MKTVNLSKFSNKWYKPGPRLKIALWYIVKVLFFKSQLPYLYLFKRGLLRMFGARIGSNVIIKPDVDIRYPWFLKIGDNVWVGEGVLIDNLTMIEIGNNVCISRGASIFTGNHDYKKEGFDLIIKPVIIEDGVWVCANVTVCQGVRLKAGSVMTAGSVISKDSEEYTVYQGIPAKPIRKRIIS